MLQLTELTTVKLSHVQGRMEKHGTEDVMCLDLAVVWNTNNRSLIAIQKQLRNALFCDLRQETASKQNELDLPVDEMPNVRVPNMNYPVALDFQQVGARVEIAYGINDVPAFVVQLAKLHKFRVTPIEGGSAEIKFSISSSADINGTIVGDLLDLLQREISIKLTMPDVAQEPEPELTEADIFASGPSSEAETKPAAKKPRPGSKAAKAAAKSATEEFLGQHGDDAP
jgi:hypothetical protein